jgi:predicted lactoylglutathione lyase
VCSGSEPSSRIDAVTRGGPFFCATRALVDASHQAALAAGATDNGAPGILARIHPTYYAGFVLDPDGHNVEFVCQT